ncbi:AAA family ATPase [Comamonas thiooxydans]|uniref:AAA family ATPase n=1 Tax=Comamonas thiooxydans TaxID=363952 RepID=A0AA42PX81_9BURK|nr:MULTISPECIES: AAA family ATPase [Comamonas]MDH1333245.1 AAA family ATPase [Comamonas thiooxydans]MDH1738982.1 AAA family ATPase [Comamonas thiooxydans]MDH1786115.1 AAA family ATPase [Comamonas thiooxydans]MPS94997.1 DNA transposition protein [Comamonas sp.]
MKRGFVKTENFKRLSEAQKLVEKRGAREAGLVLIQGHYGIGKSELTERWAADSGWVFVRAQSTWTKRAMLDVLAEKMGLAKTGRNQEVQARIIGKLAVEMVPMIIDEADFLVGSTASLLEVIRDITDLTGTMCFLVGMEHFPMKVARFGHIASRVAKVVELQPISLEDVKATVAAKAEVRIADDVLPEMLRQAEGRMRLLLNAIANIEAWADANGWDEVTLDLIKGRPLCPEFTGKPLGRNRGATK